jgi:hypothetical protein
MHVKCNNDPQMHNHCCSIKAVSIRYSECVSVALVIQHAKRMRRVIFSSVACLFLPYISTYFINGTILGKKLLRINCLLNFPTTFAWNTYHSKKNSVRYHKYTQFLSDFNETVIFSFLSNLIENETFCTDFRKNTQIPNFMKNPSIRSRVVPYGRAGR